MQEFKLSVAEIVGRPGAGRHVSVEAPIAGVATALARVPSAAPVAGDLRVDGVMEGVAVTGTVAAPIEAECARCLKPVSSQLEVEVGELFVADGADEEDVYRIDGHEIDLEPMIRDVLVLALPLNPVCREDCKGLCSGCGRDLAEGSCDCNEAERDPRWAGLDEIRARLEEAG